MRIQNVSCGRLVAVRLDPGEDILESLTAMVQENALRSGMILNGVGSLSRYHVHVVKTPNRPPGDVFFAGEGAYDILSLTGFILDGRVHAHITFSDPEKAMGGHLEKGCQVLTFCLALLAETPEADFSAWDKLLLA